jgi:hypothetical protein
VREGGGVRVLKENYKQDEQHYDIQVRSKAARVLMMAHCCLRRYPSTRKNSIGALPNTPTFILMRHSGSDGNCRCIIQNRRCMGVIPNSNSTQSNKQATQQSTMSFVT